MKRKKTLAVLFSTITFIIVCCIFWGMIAHWANKQPDPYVLFTGEIGTVYSNYYHSFKQIISYPFYYLCCCLYSFLSSRYYKLSHYNSYKLKNHLAYTIVGFIVGIISLFISTAIAMVMEICFLSLFKTDDSLHILGAIHTLTIHMVSIFLSVVIYTLLAEKELVKLKSNINK